LINSKNFKGQRIRIDFDEYIVLKDLDKELNVSPPLKKQPKVWVKDKSIIVQYNDTLINNTTYTFSFGNSIVDNNEGNVLENFEFVFSTGDTIDTLGIFGTVVDAFKMQPPTDRILVALYTNPSDTAPMKLRPLYTARTDKKGFFNIRHVKKGKYKLYAFSDKNFNYRYDPYTEAFAFFDSLIDLNSQNIAQRAIPLLTDTLHGADSSQNPTIDSARLKELNNSLHIDLLLFTEENPQQFIKGYYRPLRELLAVKFNHPVVPDSIMLKTLFYKTPEHWYICETLKKQSDSLLFWLTDTMLIKSDTLRLQLTYTSKGKPTADTLMFRYFVTENKTQFNSEKMKIKLSAGTSIEPNHQLLIETQYPISRFYADSILLFETRDTTWFRIPINLESDSFSSRKFILKNNWQPEKKYRLIIYPSAFKNIYNKLYDTIRSNFSVQKMENFGTLYIQPINFFYPCIVQLLQKETVVYEQYFIKEERMKWEYLQPGEYTLRAIWDADRNRKFTTGNFINHRQPETVRIYPENIKIRANWEVEINWQIKR
ncbi:MAG: Ig-like domain-containing domain, partial [Bacteroidales bacterium]|nr:Ig-like domain-containing domain [Bacteroidales bacterium]